MRVLHLSDTHGLHRRLQDMPAADVVVHSGDFSQKGTEAEVLDFLNWYIELPYPHKIFVTGNHDLCLRDAVDIENLPPDVHFLQDCGVDICGLKFFGLAYDHSAELIPDDVDIVVTHEPPVMTLDKSAGIHWGNAPLRNRIQAVKPRYHLFGHAHNAYGTLEQDGIVFSNASLLNERNQLVRKPRLFVLK